MLWTRESESKEESDLLWTQESESKEESDLLWTQESESKGESDFILTQESESKEESDLIWTQESESKEESDLLWTLESNGLQSPKSKPNGLRALPWPSIAQFARARCPFSPLLRPYSPGGAARGSHTGLNFRVSDLAVVS